jgi:DNA-binding NarL/FixJ family response regulator
VEHPQAADRRRPLLRAVVIEDWDVLRHGLIAVLKDQGVVAVASTTNGASGLEAVRTAEPDLVVVGRCPDMAADVLVRRLDQLRRCAHLLVLVDSAHRGDPVTLLGLGATGLVPRTVTVEELGDALGRFARGERYVAASVLAAQARAQPEELGPCGELTVRERSVLAQIMGGRSNQEIASALFIGTETVKTHLRNLYAKLGVSNRREATQFALGSGLAA